MHTVCQADEDPPQESLEVAPMENLLIHPPTQRSTCWGGGGVNPKNTNECPRHMPTTALCTCINPSYGYGIGPYPISEVKRHVLLGSSNMACIFLRNGLRNCGGTGPEAPKIPHSPGVGGLKKLGFWSTHAPTHASHPPPELCGGTAQSNGLTETQARTHARTHAHTHTHNHAPTHTCTRAHPPTRALIPTPLPNHMHIYTHMHTQCTARAKH